MTGAARKKNTGKPSQIIFEGWIASFGFDAFLYRVTDSAEVRGLNTGMRQGRGPLAFTKAQPADFIVTIKNWGTAYYEVKSCSDKVSFSKSQIEKTQWSTAIQVTKAGGHYFFMLHAIALKKWFRVDACQFIAGDKKSWKWSGLEPWRCHELEKWHAGAL